MVRPGTTDGGVSIKRYSAIPPDSHQPTVVCVAGWQHVNGLGQATLPLDIHGSLASLMVSPSQTSVINAGSSN